MESCIALTSMDEIAFISMTSTSRKRLDLVDGGGEMII